MMKFMEKYNINYPEQSIEKEITKFIQREKLTDRDLQRLNNKIQKLAKNTSDRNILEKKMNQELKSPVNPDNKKNYFTEELINNNNKKNAKLNDENFTEINNLNNTLYPRNDVISLPKVTGKMEPEPKKLKHSQSSMNIANNTYTLFPKYNYLTKKLYKSPEEELAELEKELEIKNYQSKDNKRIDFSKEGNEWSAITKYKQKLYEKQLKEERLRENEMKKRTKEDLDNQIKQKIKIKYEEKLREKEGDKLFQEHLKKIDQIEKEKQEALKQQIMREKKNRDAQIRDEYVRKRIDQLKQRKFENALIKNIQEEIEKEKQAAIQKKIKENEALKRVIRENEINKEKQKELLQKEKEEDIRAYEEMEKNEMKQDMERKRYFDNIRRFANKYDEEEVNKLLNKMKQDQKEEDEKVYQLMLENNQRAEEQELRAKMKRAQEKQAIKKFLDMQIEEKRKEAELQKAINDEQARIWNADCKKYNEDEKRIDKIIRDMNKRNLDNIMEQIRIRKEQKKAQAMSRVEYAMNRDALEKAREEIDKNNA